MPDGFADSGGVRIHFADRGGDGPPLVLVHATGFHTHVWDPYMPALRDRFRVVTVDQRGHGDSDKPEGGYEWPNYGHDVLAVVDELGLASPAGAGHSSGAAALIYAESFRPGTFSRLALLDPVAPPPEIRQHMGQMDNPMAMGARRRRRIWDSREAMIERMRTGTPLATWREEFLRAYVIGGTRSLEDGTFELKCPPEAEAQMYEHGSDQDAWERLASLGCPTTLVFGSRSQLWTRQRYEAAVARVPHGRLEVIDGTHFFPMEKPDETVDVLLSSLSAEW